jgi:hypothetical protein
MNPLAKVANKDPLAILAQKRRLTYPAKDSKSYITPYTQRDHTWTDDQHDVSDEV